MQGGPRPGLGAGGGVTALRLLVLIVAVAQTIGVLDSLCVRDKMTILG